MLLVIEKEDEAPIAIADPNQDPPVLMAGSTQSLLVENRHPSEVFVDITIALEGDGPPFVGIDSRTYLLAGENWKPLIPTDAHIRVSFHDMDGNIWVRRWVGQDYVLERYDPDQ